MLWGLALLLAGRALGQTIPCVDDGSTGMTQSGSNNYVIDLFTGTLLFTYAINQCTGVDLLDSSVFYKYTCSQDDDDVWWVTKTSYSDASCTADKTDIDTWSEKETMEGEIGYFKCDGKNNYASIQIGIDSSCEGTTTIIGGLGGCAKNPALADTKFYCDSTMALVQLYDTNSTQYGMCDDEHYFCNKWTFTSTCQPAAQLFGQVVYGTFSKCATSEPVNEGNGGEDSGEDSGDGDGDEESSASSQFTLLAIVVSLIASFFH